MVNADHSKQCVTAGETRPRVDFSTLQEGERLLIVAPGAPGFAKIGDTVLVTAASRRGAIVRADSGEFCLFCYSPGAKRLRRP